MKLYKNLARVFLTAMERADELYGQGKSEDGFEKAYSLGHDDRCQVE